MLNNCINNKNKTKDNLSATQFLKEDNNNPRNADGEKKCWIWMSALLQKEGTHAPMPTFRTQSFPFIDTFLFKYYVDSACLMCASKSTMTNK